MGKESEEAKYPNLQIEGFSPHANILRVAISNTGGSTAKKCFGKITLEHTKDDVIDWPEIPAFITTKFYDQVDKLKLRH